MTLHEAMMRLAELASHGKLSPDVRAEVEAMLMGGIQPDTQGAEPTTVLLRIPPQDKPVYFLVKGRRFRSHERPDDVSEYDGGRHWYEEHTCPTNWIGDVVVVAAGGDTDPHGLFEFCDWEPGAPRESDDTTAESEHAKEMIAKFEAECAEFAGETLRKAT